MIGDYYEGEKRQKVIGWQGSATKVGALAFMLLGGFLANFDWRVPFLGYGNGLCDQTLCVRISARR